MRRGHGEHATRPAGRGTHATGSGGSPASSDSATKPGTRPRRRRPLPGAPPPHEHDRQDRLLSQPHVNEQTLTRISRVGRGQILPFGAGVALLRHRHRPRNQY